MRGEVEARVGPYGRTELSHDRRRPHASSHDVANGKDGASAAEGDHVVPAAAVAAEQMKPPSAPVASGCSVNQG
ncbi:hypothetical protein GCM10010293_49770 [Streptomyces griseoflavus]|nr:hypothetical protein GCM10010293_49770 [Streptomyces griseoflavus]